MGEPVVEFRSEQSPTVVYACPMCKLTNAGGRAAAAACCVCIGCGAPAARGRTMCEACSEIAAERRARERHAAEVAWPVVDDNGEPVCVDDRFYESAHEAAVALWEDGEDPTVAVAMPCTVGPAGTPDLVEVVEVAWMGGFDDPDVIEVPAAARQALAAAQELCEANAPTVWAPRTGERVQLEAVADVGR